MADGGIVPGLAAKIEPQEGCYIPLQDEQSETYRERTRAIWAEAARCLGVSDG